MTVFKEPTDDQVIEAMETYGGSFVKSLAKTYRLADGEYKDTIKRAFYDLWDRYRDMAIKKP